MSNKMKNILLISTTFISILSLIVLGVVIYTHNDDPTKDNVNEVITSSPIEKTERSLSGKSIEEDKKDVAKIAAELLTLANQDDSGKDAEERVAALDNKDYSVLKVDEMKEFIRFSGEFDNNEDIQIVVYQSLVSLASFLGDSSTGEVSYTADSYLNVYLDQETGQAFVPIDIYSQDGSGFSLEFIYVEDEGWQFTPYSLLDIVKLSSML